MSESLESALARVRGWLLDDDVLVRAVASGRRRGADLAPPPWRRLELRHVDLKTGRHLQVVRYDATQAHTANHRPGAAPAVVEELLAQPFGHWTVETTTATHQLRVTKKGAALLHTAARAEPVAEVVRDHDHGKDRLLPEDDPLLRELGLSGADGRVRPTRRAKYRQVEEFVRQLDAALADAREAGRLRRPTEADPWRVADLGCGNGYLTLAALRHLQRLGLPARVVGVDVKQQSREHNAAVAARLGLAADFRVATIAEVVIDPAPEVVLALHACDTATDEALARAVAWQAPLVLAAPCCHHDVAAQLRRVGAPAPYAELVRHGILRERLADTLTDALRASLLRLHRYRVEVVEFVDSAHTPRNTMLRAVRTGAAPGADARQEYDDLVGGWQLRPRLAELAGVPEA